MARLCVHSADRIGKWLLPVIRDNLASGEPIRLAAATVPSWARYAEGLDEQGQSIEVADRLAGSLVPIARSQHTHPTGFIENTAVLEDLAQVQRFVEAYRWALDCLHRRGARAGVDSRPEP